MKNSKDLKVKLAEVENSAKELINLAKSEERDFSEKENEDFDSYKNEIENLKNEITRTEEIEKFEASLAGQTAPKKSIVQENMKEAKRFSLHKFIRECAAGKLSGVEAEVNQEANSMANSIGASIKNFGLLPEFLTVSNDVTVGGDAKGAELVPEDHTGFIEFLRNNMVVAQAGAQILSGLVGDQKIPKQTASASAEWLDENSAVTKSDQVYGAVGMSPKRLAARTHVSKQSIIQSVPSVEALTRNDLLSVIAIALDKAALAGSGVSPEPTGITGFATAATIGGVPTFKDFVAMETTIREANINNPISYVSTPAMVGLLKTVSKGVNLDSPINVDGEVNGYPILATTQLSDVVGGGTSGVYPIIAGDFSQLLIGNWGVLDLMVDPYTLAEQSLYRMIVEGFYDIKARYDEAFVYCDDATLA